MFVADKQTAKTAHGKGCRVLNYNERKPSTKLI